ncbi:MAG: hypothetical protein JXB35_05090 [Anaerolineae bacterium]|nr:hypothetical protein [Anaerolineae bacterium]
MMDFEASIPDPEVQLRRETAADRVSLERALLWVSPRIRAVVEAIAQGERIDLPPAAPPPEPPPGKVPYAFFTTADMARSWLGDPYPTLLRLMEEGILTPDEAVSAAQVIDGIVGRYMTGTRYAAP